jgi:hypothetical protein
MPMLDDVCKDKQADTIAWQFFDQQADLVTLSC